MTYDQNVCGVDGCTAPVMLSMLDDVAGRWLVRHGLDGEAAAEFDSRVLFIITGYRPWVRAVHAYEQRLSGPT